MPEVGRRWSIQTLHVISDSLTPEQAAPWHNTRIVQRADAHEQVAELKRQPDEEILDFGSHTLWHDLLAGGLVDELHRMIGPAFPGGGTPVFEGRSPAALRLLESRTLERSELVRIRYGVRR